MRCSFSKLMDILSIPIFWSEEVGTSALSTAARAQIMPTAGTCGWLFVVNGREGHANGRRGKPA